MVVEEQEEEEEEEEQNEMEKGQQKGSEVKHEPRDVEYEVGTAERDYYKKEWEVEKSLFAL